LTHDVLVKVMVLA